MRGLSGKLRSGLGKSAFVLLWLAPVWLLLGVCRLAILTLSFQRLARLFGAAHGSAACVALLADRQRQLVVKIGQVVHLAARYTPWTTNCFPQALTACLLLALYRLPHCLCFGVARDPQDHGFSAHAWVAADSVRVIGGESFSKYRVLACFVWFPSFARYGHDVPLHHSQSSLSAAPGLSAPADDGTRNP